MLTYEGQDAFKTHCGGMISLVIFSALSVYLALQLNVLMTFGDTSVSKSTLFQELIDIDTVHEIGEAGFMFGLSLNYDGNEMLNDPTYFTYTVKQVIQEYDATIDGNVRTKTDRAIAACGTDSFENADPNNIERLGIDEYLCPTDDNMTVAGSFFSTRFDYIELKFYKCNPSDTTVTCQSDTDIEDVMKESKLNMAIDNTYFDFSNYDDPIQHYLDETFFWDLLPGFRKKTDIFVRQNEVSLIDDLVQLGQSNETEFYQVINYREQLELEDASDLEFLSVFIRFDAFYDVYERRVYSIGDLLGQLGGVYESLMLSGALLVGVFSERLFISSILHKIYQIDQLREKEVFDEFHKKKDNKVSAITKPDESSHTEIPTVGKLNNEDNS